LLQNKFLIIGILLAVLAGAGVAIFLAMAVPTTQVVKVGESIKPGDNLRGCLYLEETPKKAVPEGAFSDIMPEDMEILESMYSIATLYKGDILRTYHISETITDGGTLSARLQGMDMKNQVGFALDQDSTAGLILEVGDRLQICAVSEHYQTGAPGQDAQEPEKKVSQPAIIVNSAPVIYVPGIEEEDGCVVVALSQDEFLKLSQAKEIGSLYAAVLPIGEK
jgi:hypothetical protein